MKIYTQFEIYRVNGIKRRYYTSSVAEGSLLSLFCSINVDIHPVTFSIDWLTVRSDFMSID